MSDEGREADLKTVGIIGHFAVGAVADPEDILAPGQLLGIDADTGPTMTMLQSGSASASAAMSA